MSNPIPAAINIRSALLLNHSGNPITTGTVNYYLIALDGDNAGKWLTKDGNWSASEAAYGSTGTPSYADAKGTAGVWEQSVIAAGWIDGVTYREYWMDTLGYVGNAPGETVYCGETGDSAADVVTALGTGSTLTALATANALATVDGNVDAILADTGTDGVKLDPTQILVP